LRAKRLFSGLDPKIDAVLIVNSRLPFLDDNFRYLTDTMGGVFEGSVAIATARRVTVITSYMEAEIAKASGCRTFPTSNRQEFDSALKKELKGFDTIGVNMSGITHSSMKWVKKSLKDARFKDVSKQLNVARMIKGEEEISRIKKACGIASKVAEEIPEIVSIGMTEKEAGAEIDHLLRGHGADGPAFETIVAFGPATAVPHHRPDNAKLKKGSIALFDFGAAYKNYRSDITRTYFTKPLRTDLAMIHQIVLKAQSAAISSIKPGIKASRIDTAARETIVDAGYGDRFIHSTGHGLGISEHDPGAIAQKSKDILKENMVFTIEPGIYLPGKGGVRIEDDVLVDKTSGRILTKAERGIVLL
jgi:Xaa-Pro dipeptidase